MSNNYWDRPCAVSGLLSYRYRGEFGWIMIGAKDDQEALREATRSTRNVVYTRLQKWNGTVYVDCAA